jgi:multidrug efflux system membrane fusion protein
MVRIDHRFVRAALAAGGFVLLVALVLTLWQYWGSFVAAQQSPGAGPPRGAKSSPETSAEKTEVPRVKVVRPTVEKHFRRTTKQPAHVEAYEQTDIYAKASGYLGRFGHALGPDGKPLLGSDGQPRDLDIGDSVDKDQVLAELWIPEMIAERELKKALKEQAEADVKKHQADVDYYGADFNRHLELHKQGGIPKDLLDVKRRQFHAAQAAKESAQARVKVAQREVEHLEALIGYREIKAPYAGIITRRLVDNGAFVQSAASGKAEPLFKIVRVDRLRVVTDIPENESKWIKLGQTATLIIDSGRKQVYQGEIKRMTEVLDPQARKLRVEVELLKAQENSSRPRPGAYGWVEVEVANYNDAVFVPASCVHYEGDKPYLLCAGSGVARRHDVKIGYYDGVRAQVIEGLRPDDLVITQGQEGIRLGQQVESVF